MRRACILFWTGLNLAKSRKLSSSQVRSFKQQKRSFKEREKEKDSCWVKKFCATPGHEFYSEIPLSFIEDPVTTATICDAIDSPHVGYAIRLLNRQVSEDPGTFEKSEWTAIENVAEELYNLLHGRYILTDEGLKSVREKYDDRVYGQCLRVFCRGHPLLPLGMHDVEKKSTVKCFCAKCRDIYTPQMLRNRGTDGVAFGTSLPHLLLQRMPELAPVQPKDRYEPRIFGFKIHETAPELQIYYKITAKLPNTDGKHHDREAD